MDLMVEWITHYGYAAIFLLLVLGIVGVPVPDEALLTFVGYLIFKGDLHAAPALGAAFLGSASWISASYGLGRFLGLRVLSHGRFLHRGHDRLAEASDWVRRRGKYVLPVAYFIPGVRHVAAIVAGSSGMTFAVFFAFASAGALLWSATFIGVGYVLGAEWVHLWATIHRAMIVIAPAAVLIIAVVSVVLWKKRRSHD